MRGTEAEKGDLEVEEQEVGDKGNERRRKKTKRAKRNRDWEPERQSRVRERKEEIREKW